MAKGRDRVRAFRQSFKDSFKGGGSITCLICTKPITRYSDLTIDHLLPKSRGGTDRFDNLAPAHTTCNYKKKDIIIPQLIYEPTNKQIVGGVPPAGKN